MEINFVTQIWQEGKMYVAYTPELDISSCGKTFLEARKNLHEAVEIFLVETAKMNTLDEILEESGFIREKNNQKIRWQPPKIISTERERVVV
ncbi:MAG: hypothetical protein US31_C0012G0025 [Berkelbacteria bacterium GW2011_GWA1_36_9]|uniref:HicB-like antitoxin of toxin-antitoxin system domain-containing protein n=1 Tax=Berkelbacteria bacterium GW2011_GWA1_36_9 TaxID=1618331 RepID=A0A0G0I140_9BACT|nr:MAG: hypothetical protein US31_C0012G0025 [Berkelbacteria bacterium GW2011_GWA1_36_9]